MRLWKGRAWPVSLAWIVGTALAVVVELPAQERESLASHILVASRAQAEKLRVAMVARGGSFDAFRSAAREHSFDVATRRLGGDLGWVRRPSMFTDAFVRSVLRCDSGQISAPIRSELGWHLVFVREVRGQGVIPAASDASDLDAPSQPSCSKRAAEILERFVAASGGRAAFAAIEDRTRRYRRRLPQAGAQQAEVTIESFVKRGGKVREHWTVHGFQVGGESLRFFQSYDGSRGWVKMLERIDDLEGTTLRAFTADKSLVGELVDWKRGGYSYIEISRNPIELPGRDDEVTIDAIERMDFTGREKVEFAFERSTGLLVHTKVISELGSVGGVRGKAGADTYLSDYRSVKLSSDAARVVRLPFRVRSFVDGKLHREEVVAEIAINTGLVDEFFARPDEPVAPGEGEKLRKN